MMGEKPVGSEKAGRDSPLSQPSLDPTPPSTAVEFEDYLYYAAVQRRAEDLATLPPGSETEVKTSWFNRLSEHKGPNVNLDVHDIDNAIPPTADELERENASRALRLASWSSVFYLITTDILGPFNAPFAISQTGWVPGVILYVVMGILAAYTGLILWRLFVRLDSVRHPLKTYGDMAERIFGRASGHVCTVLQSIQLLVNVATICLGNGQALSQITKGKLCFAVCIVIWSIVGFVVGQIRSLKNYGWLANGAVWFNLLIIFTSMGFVAHSPPNYAAAQTSLGVPFGPVTTELFSTLPLFNRVNGIMNMVFAYGGAMIFPEIMAEMRRPMDFWKGMVLAQLLIGVAYLLYGVFVYAFQGQFTLPLAFQGVSRYSWQTVGNVFFSHNWDHCGWIVWKYWNQDRLHQYHRRLVKWSSSFVVQRSINMDSNGICVLVALLRCRCCHPSNPNDCWPHRLSRYPSILIHFPAHLTFRL